MSGPGKADRDEVGRLRARVEALEWQLREQRRRELQARADGEALAEALRASWSWRVTAPLRFVHRLLSRLLGARR